MNQHNPEIPLVEVNDRPQPIERVVARAYDGQIRDEDRQLTQQFAVLRKKAIEAGRRQKEKTKKGEISQRKVRSIIGRDPKTGQIIWGPGYETVTISQDKRRKLLLIPHEILGQTQILLTLNYAVAQDELRFGLQNADSVPSANFHPNDTFDTSSKYHDGLTLVATEETDTFYADVDKNRVVTLDDFEKYMLNNDGDVITDGELIAAVIRWKYQQELKGHPVPIDGVQEYLSKYIKHITSLPTYGESEWFKIVKGTDQETGETKEFVRTTNEALSVLVYVINGEVYFLLMYERTPALYYCNALLTSGGTINEDIENTLAASMRESRQELGVKIGEDLGRLGAAFYRSDQVDASTHTRLLLVESFDPSKKSGGDEKFEPVPALFSLNQVKQLIADGLISDIGTVVSLGKAITKIEKDQAFRESILGGANGRRLPLPPTRVSF